MLKRQDISLGMKILLLGFVVFSFFLYFFVASFFTLQARYERAGAQMEILSIIDQTSRTRQANAEIPMLGMVVDTLHAEIDLAAAKIKFYNLEVEIQSKKYPDYDLERYEFAKSELKRLNEKIGIPYESKYRIPTDLFYIFLKDDDAYVTQSPRQHFAANGLLATDLGTHGKSLPIYAPDMYNNEVEWTIEEKEYPESSGHTLILTNEKLGARWLIGHVKSNPTKSKARTGEFIGMSGGFPGEGVTSGPHAHLEFFTRVGGAWLATNYTLLNSNKHEQWNFKPDDSLFSSEESVRVYLSGYNAGDPNQNDASPCIGASGRNICEMLDEGKKVIALTSDIRNLLGIEFGDKVLLNGEIEVFVEDEMAARFRSDCIKSNNSGTLCIKGDFAFPFGEPVRGFAATISKI